VCYSSVVINTEKENVCVTMTQCYYRVVQSRESREKCASL